MYNVTVRHVRLDPKPERLWMRFLVDADDEEQAARKVRGHYDGGERFEVVAIMPCLDGIWCAESEAVPVWPE